MRRQGLAFKVSIAGFRIAQMPAHPDMLQAQGVRQQLREEPSIPDPRSYIEREGFRKLRILDRHLLRESSDDIAATEAPGVQLTLLFAHDENLSILTRLQWLHNFCTIKARAFGAPIAACEHPEQLGSTLAVSSLDFALVALKEIEQSVGHLDLAARRARY
mgnify:CR=1 FL=1